LAKPLLIGSGNPGKAQELAVLLEGLPWEVKSLNDFPRTPAPEEDGGSFEANAVKKALYYCGRFALACVADDSGLIVDALGGAPGVYSARYAGEEQDPVKNNAKLLAELADTPWPARTARFACCAAFVEPDGEAHVEVGTVEGHISMACFGDNGFGYDPLFVPTGQEQTFAEMAPEAKHAISHRGMAFQKLRAYLERLA